MAKSYHGPDLTRLAYAAYDAIRRDVAEHRFPLPAKGIDTTQQKERQEKNEKNQ